MVRVAPPHILPPRLRWQIARQKAWARYNRDARNGHAKAIRQFEEKVGYTPDLAAPRSHNERILARKLFDHDPRYCVISDKVAARTFIDERLGKGSADELCVPILAHVEDFADLPDEIWTQDVMLKCTHGSSMNIVVKAGDAAGKRRARRWINHWMGRVHAAKRFEWSYLDLKPSIVAEPLLKVGYPSDLKLYFYDGELGFCMPEDNATSPPEICLKTADWQDLGLDLKDFEMVDFDPPKHLAEILEVAKPLAAGFDTIRVDFLLTEDRFYLGELTVYDGSGLAPWSKKQDDIFAGHYWSQPHLGLA